MRLALVKLKKKSTHPSPTWLKVWVSSTCMALTCSRFRVRQRTTFPCGSTSLSSTIQIPDREMMPFGAHLGNVPVLRMRRVVKREPEGENSREITSHEMTCEAKGFG